MSFLIETMVMLIMVMAVVGTVSGTSISFGTQVVYSERAAIAQISSAFDL